MKTFNEILKDIEAMRKAIDKSESNEKRLETEWTNILDMKERHEKRKALETEWNTAAQETKDLYLSLRILKNNARIALFNDVIPVLLEVLTKYKGKPYGEKTRDKISKETEEKAGARAYICTNYNQDQISVYPSSGYGNDYSITIGTKYIEGKQDRILIDNKIQIVPIENFCLWYIKDKYISDIPAAIADMKELYSKAVSMQKELDKVCSAFNKYAVNGIEPIYCDKRIFERMLVK